MNIQDVLLELGKQMGLPNLKLDDNKVCRLIFDKKYTVDIEASEDEKTVHIYSALCIIPPERKEEMYEALLEANLFGRGTGGSAFGVDIEMGEVLLSRTIQMEKTEYQDFVNVLEGFVNHVEAWTDKIDSGDYSKGGKGFGPSKKSQQALGEGDLPPSPAPPSSDQPPEGFIRA